MKKVKPKIFGEEFKLNNGGRSFFVCFYCNKRVYKHISGAGEDRLFCKYCGRKWERNSNPESKFVRIPIAKFNKLIGFGHSFDSFKLK